MSSSNIVTTNDFALLLGGLESFYNAQLATTSRATTVVASPNSTHAQLPTAHQSHDYQQQPQQHKQQQSSPQLQTLALDSPRSEVRPSTTLPATAATTEAEMCPPDQQASLSTQARVTFIPSPDRDLSDPDSAHGTINQSIQSASTTTLTTSSRAMTKSIQSSPLCTNAAEFITNYFRYMPAPTQTSHCNKDSQSVASTHLPELSAAAPQTIVHRSVDSHPTQDHQVEHEQSRRLPTVPKEDEAVDGYSRHHGRLRFDPYASADLLPGADDGRSAPVALETLLEEPHETVLTEEEKRTMIEYGRAIGSSGNLPPRRRHDNCSNNNRSNNNYSQRQRDNHTNTDMPLRGTGGRGYRFKITYSRDFLMSFRAFNVPPEGIDRIHWIQQNPTQDYLQKTPELRMARPQPIIQEPRGNYQGAGTYDSEMGHRQLGRGGDFRGEGAIRDVGFEREIGSRGARGQSTAFGNGPFREGPQGTSGESGGFRGESRQGTFRGEGTFRGDVVSNEDNRLRSDSGFGAPSFSSSPPPLPPPPALRLHFQRSSASATGGLSGSVFNFKTRRPLGPPAAPRSGFQMRGFKTRTTL
ncbi:MAG: hypothetical protein JOS17DRAFT_834334 [Linnemannia elongata]|nr:MAG: hypothetical protein JOS17DRAFT_834334 [Linnemannia elongata]